MLLFPPPQQLILFILRKLIFVFMSLNVDFAALKAATKGSPWMGPSFTWMDQDPRGPWTRCSTRPCLSLPVCETVRQANGLRDVDWTFGKFILLIQKYHISITGISNPTSPIRSQKCTLPVLKMSAFPGKILDRQTDFARGLPSLPVNFPLPCYLE